MLIDSRAGSEVFQFKELANFDLPFLIFPMGIGRTLGPFDGFFSRFHVDQPVAGDQRPGFGKGTIEFRQAAFYRQPLPELSIWS